MSNLTICNQNPSISYTIASVSLGQNSLPDDINYQNTNLQKYVHPCYFISSLTIPQQMKDGFIKNSFKGSDFNVSVNGPYLNSSSNMKDLQQKMNPFNICLNKPQYSNNHKATRVKFTKEEDDKIIQLVDKFGTHQWKLIALCMERRTAKQCRDRYMNYLIPGCFQGEWSKDEDKLLSQLYDQLGPKWSAIKKYFPNRGCNNIKSRWYYFIRKQNMIQSNSNKEDNSNKNDQNQ